MTDLVCISLLQPKRWFLPQVGQCGQQGEVHLSRPCLSPQAPGIRCKMDAFPVAIWYLLVSQFGIGVWEVRWCFLITSCSPLFSTRRRMTLTESEASLIMAVCNTLFPSQPIVSNKSSRASLRALRKSRVSISFDPTSHYMMMIDWNWMMMMMMLRSHLGESLVVRVSNAEIRPSITFSSNSWLSISIKMMMAMMMVKMAC